MLQLPPEITVSWFRTTLLQIEQTLSPEVRTELTLPKLLLAAYATGIMREESTITMADYVGMTALINDIITDDMRHVATSRVPLTTYLMGYLSLEIDAGIDLAKLQVLTGILIGDEAMPMADTEQLVKSRYEEYTAFSPIGTLVNHVKAFAQFLIDAGLPQTEQETAVRNLLGFDWHTALSIDPTLITVLTDLLDEMEAIGFVAYTHELQRSYLHGKFRDVIIPAVGRYALIDVQ